MKAIQTRIYLLQVLLISLAAALTLLGFFFANQDVVLWPAVWGYIHQGDDKIPVLLGVIRFAHLAYFTGFLLLYLACEFYGFKTGLYAALSLAVVMAGIYFLFFGLNILSSNHPSIIDRRLLATFTLKHREFVANLISFFSGTTLTFLLAMTLKKLTRDYFMFFRFTVATLIGFAVFTTIETWLGGFGFPGDETFFVAAITPAAQFSILTILSVVPLYLMRLILVFFRGRATDKLLMDSAVNSMPTNVAEASRDGFSWALLFFVPAFLGGLVGLIFFVLLKAYDHGLFPSAPAIIRTAATDPETAVIYLGSTVAIILFSIRLGIHLAGKMLSRKKSKTVFAPAKQSIPSEEPMPSKKISTTERPA